MFRQGLVGWRLLYDRPIAPRMQHELPARQKHTSWQPGQPGEGQSVPSACQWCSSWRSECRALWAGGRGIGHPSVTAQTTAQQADH